MEDPIRVRAIADYLAHSMDGSLRLRNHDYRRKTSVDRILWPAYFTHL